MKILYSHLKKYLNSDIDIKTISNSLFQLGHENTILDDLIDIEFTPNKGDCLSVYGIARDLNALHSANLNVDLYNKEIDELNFNFINEEKPSCPKLSFLNIEINSLPKKYNNYLEDYFYQLDNKKNNFFTDVSNYLAYEIGQPTHCYEYNKVKNGLTLSKLKNDSEFITLSNKNISLKENDLVFHSNDEIVNLAGIMGGNETACNDKTTNVLIEFAFFRSEDIIGKSIKYDLNSEAAYKFERGVDPNLQDMAIKRFIKIIEDHVEIKSLSIAKYDFLDHSPRQIEFKPNEINKILGICIDELKIKNILNSLGISIKKNSLNIPSWRKDLLNNNDIAEEVARVIGYNNIKGEKFTPLNINEIKKSVVDLNENQLKNFFIAHGLTEVINDPFVINSSENSIQIDNPLDKNKKFMRLNIIDSLIKNLEYNEKRQKDSIKIFEISDIYYLNKNEIKSDKLVSIVVSGREGNNPRSFFKKLDDNFIRELINKIGIDATKISEIGREKIKSKARSKIYGIEFNLSEIDFDYFNNMNLNNDINFIKYKPISEYPMITRDISISISSIEIFDEVIALIEEVQLNHIKEKLIFDYFENKKNKTYKLGYRLIFQSSNDTLTDNDVDQEMLKVYELILKLDGVSIPGLN